MHFQEQQERDETGIPTAKQGKQLFTRGELTGMGMALCLLVYGLFQQDIPLVFLTSSFLVFEAHSFFAQSGSPQVLLLAVFVLALPKTFAKNCSHVLPHNGLKFGTSQDAKL